MGLRNARPQKAAEIRKRLQQAAVVARDVRVDDDAAWLRAQM